MAHSFLTYRGESEMMRDSDILLIIGLLRAHAASDSKAAALFVSWFEGYDEMPSGAIDLRLDDHLADSAIARDMAAALNSARSRIQGFGQAVPGTYIDEVLGADEAYSHKSRPMDEVDGKLARLQALTLSQQT